jgi:hypothetical protein
MELGRSWRTLLMMLLLRPRGAGELRGHRQQAALKDQRFRGRVPPLYPIDSRARGRQRDPLGPPQAITAGAATWPPPIPFSLNSVRGRGDRCVGQRSDPLGPPGRRCGCSIRFGAAAIAASVSGATRSGRLGGAAAAQFGSGPRRSLRRSAERPARAAWAALRLLADVAIGATMELQRSWRTLLLMMLLLRPHGAGEPRGHRQQAALKDQRFREARSSSLSDDSRARGRQCDPLGPPSGRRRRFHFFREIRFGAAAIAASVSGATRSGRLGGAAAAGRRRHRGDDGARALVANAAADDVAAAAARRRRATGSSPTGGIERPAV